MGSALLSPLIWGCKSEKRREKKKYQKIDDNGELVIEWKKEKSIKDVVVENICYD